MLEMKFQSKQIRQECNSLFVIFTDVNSLILKPVVFYPHASTSVAC